jgi:hypothetical protein
VTLAILHRPTLVTIIVSLGTQQVIVLSKIDSYILCSYSVYFYFLAFIDPFFSSGVHLALTGGLAAAVTIASSIRGEYSETEVCKYHNAKIGVAYTRYIQCLCFYLSPEQVVDFSLLS